MVKKRRIFIAVVLVAIIASVVLFINKPEDYSSFIASGSSAEGYEQQKEVGYITVDLDQLNNPSKKVLKVEDKALQSKLQQTNLADVIGVNMIMTIPAKELKSTHIDFDNMDIFDVLYATDEFDKYITVTDISLK